MWGDIDSSSYLAEKIASAKVSATYWRWSEVASEKFGQGSERFAIHHQDWSGAGTRPGGAAMMLAYMTSRHRRAPQPCLGHNLRRAKGRESTEGKAAKVIELQRIRPSFDLLGCCRLQWVEIGFEFDYYPVMFGGRTGRKITEKELYDARSGCGT